MLNVKDWIKLRKKPQFELINHGNVYAIQNAKRLKDDIIFDVAGLVKHKDGEIWVLMSFNEDRIHCKISQIDFSSSKAKYESIHVEINELTKI
jgi:hypothetical protein